MRIHTGYKLHTSGTCGKSFTRSYTLKNHTLIHTGEKQYTCDFNGRCLTQSSNLKTYMRVHTGDKPYTCHSSQSSKELLQGMGN